MEEIGILLKKKRKYIDMKQFTFLLLLTMSFTTYSQDIVILPFEKVKGVKYKTEEREFFSNLWDTQVITNVSTPTLAVYEPEKAKRNGTSVIIAPGGGLYGLSINSEGIEVAKWLNEKGITAFVLKYRLVPSGEDGIAEINNLAEKDPDKLYENVGIVLPYSVQDGLNAVAYVRENAVKYGIKTDKIGFMGFSAGGAVTMGVAYTSGASNKPDFLVPVYPWTTAQPVQSAPENASPMLIICATDDALGLASGSIELYNSWHNSKLNVALHMYSKGGHGFGMRKNGMPTDNWIERFYEWAVAEGIVLE